MILARPTCSIQVDNSILTSRASRSVTGMGERDRSTSTSKSSSSKRRKREEAADSSADESTSSRRSSKSTKDKKKHKKKSSHRDEDSGAESSASSTSISSVSSAASSSSVKKSKRSSKTASASNAYITSQPVSSAFELQYPVLTVALPPIHCSDPSAAVAEMLDSLIMRFVPPLNGVLVSHGQTYFLTDGGVESASAVVEADSAFAKAQVAVECCVWRPRVGIKVQGTITLSTPSHVSLLVHSTFNASIPKAHLDEYYEYVEGSGALDGEDSFDEDKGEDEDASGGHWRHRKTRQPLGAANEGRVDFVVVSLTISGHSLSLGGSLLSRPFSVAASRGDEFLASQLQGGSASERASKFGLGDSSAGKRQRRVRWEGELSDSDSDSGAEAEIGPMRPEIKSTGKHVKF
ncbi:unnamed protein product [Parajaminaea phylloscopi]